MIIGHLAKIVAPQSGGAIKAGFVFVALLAIFNAAGRIVAGVVSDRIGRIVTLVLVFVLQAFNMFFFAQLPHLRRVPLRRGLVGFSYGACLSLFPATAADHWGTKNLGLNYGILFTAWGVGGVFGPMLAGKIADATGSYALAYQIAAGLLMVATLLAMFAYVNVSVNVPEREITLTLGKKKRAEAEAAAAAKAAEPGLAPGERVAAPLHGGADDGLAPGHHVAGRLVHEAPQALERDPRLRRIGHRGQHRGARPPRGPLVGLLGVELHAGLGHRVVLRLERARHRAVHREGLHGHVGERSHHLLAVAHRRAERLRRHAGGVAEEELVQAGHAPLPAEAPGRRRGNPGLGSLGRLPRQVEEGEASLGGPLEEHAGDEQAVDSRWCPRRCG